MSRRMIWAAAIVAAGVGLAGCQSQDVPVNQRLVVQLRETSGENPVNAQVQVDGKVVFGPADLAPGETRNIPLHEPTVDNGPKLAVGAHTIRWRLVKNGMWGKAGDAELTLFAGANKPLPIRFNSTRYVWPNIPVNGSIDLKLLPQPSGSAVSPEKPAPKPH